MRMQIGSYDVTVDDRDSDIFDQKWYTAADIRLAIAARMALPDYIRLRSVDGDITNCRRSNIESVPSKGPSGKRMLIHYNLDCFGIRDAVGSSSGAIVYLSPEDFRYVVQWSWVMGKKYVYRLATARGGVRRKVYLHRVVGERMGLQGYVRFIDGNPLNCKRANLTDKPRKRVYVRDTPDPLVDTLKGEIRRLIKESSL